MRTPGPFAGTMMAVTLIAVCAVIWRGPLPGGIDGIWEKTFGAVEAETTELAALEKHGNGEGLACPKDVCSGPVDIVAPDFPVSVNELRRVVLSIAKEEINTILIEFTGTDPPMDRYLVRSTILRLPSIVTIRYIPRGPERSSFVIHARPQIDLVSFGANRDRVRRWVVLATQRSGFVQGKRQALDQDGGIFKKIVLIQ